MISAPPVLVRGMRVGFQRSRPVLSELDATFAAASLTVIVGSNGSGKSTLLRALARQMPYEGTVLLGDLPLESLGRRRMARRVAYLPQSPEAPDGITVRGLVERGREPHRRPLLPLSREDRAAVHRAMERCAVDDLADRSVGALSGGQRQRAWVALALAQNASVLLLDEPTSYLDLAHQVSLLQTCKELAAEGRTVVAVLHDLNLAAAFADQVLVIGGGSALTQGAPHEVLNEALLAEAFGLRSQVIPDPLTGAPVILPRAETPTPAQTGVK